MTTYRPPKEFKPNKGISTDAIYLYGPDTWQKELAADLRKIKGSNILIASMDHYIWSLDALNNSETALFYLKTKEQDNIVLSLLEVPAWSQWAADVYVYITPQYHLRKEVVALHEKSKKLFELVDKSEDLTTIGIDSFQYLKEKETVDV
jgi:hypothetical protein